MRRTALAALVLALLGALALLRDEPARRRQALAHPSGPQRTSPVRPSDLAFPEPVAPLPETLVVPPGDVPDEGRTLALPPPEQDPQAPLRLRVLAAETAWPLSGVRLGLRREGATGSSGRAGCLFEVPRTEAQVLEVASVFASPPLIRLESGEGGLTRGCFAPRGRYTVVSDDHAWTVVRPAALDVFRREEQTVDVAVWPAGSVEGRVLDARGSPCAGAVVALVFPTEAVEELSSPRLTEVEDRGTPMRGTLSGVFGEVDEDGRVGLVRRWVSLPDFGDLSWPASYRVAVTDELGRFRLRELPSGVELRLVSYAPEHATTAWQPFRLSQGEERPLPDLTLAHGGSLVLRVAGPDGPLAGATVRFVDDDRVSFQHLRPGTLGESDAGGRLRVDHLPAERYRLRVHRGARSRKADALLDVWIEEERTTELRVVL